MACRPGEPVLRATIDEARSSIGWAVPGGARGLRGESSRPPWHATKDGPRRGGPDRVLLWSDRHWRCGADGVSRALVGCLGGDAACCPGPGTRCGFGASAGWVRPAGPGPRVHVHVPRYANNDRGRAAPLAQRPVTREGIGRRRHPACVGSRGSCSSIQRTRACYWESRDPDGAPSLRPGVSGARVDRRAARRNRHNRRSSPSCEVGSATCRSVPVSFLSTTRRTAGGCGARSPGSPRSRDASRPARPPRGVAWRPGRPPRQSMAPAPAAKRQATSRAS
jgi:hypothetical protein